LEEDSEDPFDGNTRVKKVKIRSKQKWLAIIPKAVNQIPTTGQAAKKKCKDVFQC
jgi:hypothetical protein